MSELHPLSPMVCPTPAQVQWADCEIGIMITYDLPVFDPTYKPRALRSEQPSPKVFCPEHLDTDQWLATAKAAGARYAILVAKHCTGFCLWPTEAYPYSVRQSPWRRGQGDIVGDFVRSCARYGLLPGIYYSIDVNDYCGIDRHQHISGSVDAYQQYRDIVEQQLTELWTHYGPWFEIWFDGGMPAERQDVLARLTALLLRHQPQAVVYQGPPQVASLVRWVGNEQGHAPEDCWSTVDTIEPSMIPGTCESRDLSTPHGRLWAPAEATMPNRDWHRAFGSGWFWRTGEDYLGYPAEHLLECYRNTVGRNCNLVLGMVIDDCGLVPESDVRQLTAFGQRVSRRYGSPIADTHGEGWAFTLPIPAGQVVTDVILMEDICRGERIRDFTLEGYWGEHWHPLASGHCIGHKRMVSIPSLRPGLLRLTVHHASAIPQVRRFAACCDP